MGGGLCRVGDFGILVGWLFRDSGGLVFGLMPVCLGGLMILVFDENLVFVDFG